MILGDRLSVDNTQLKAELLSVKPIEDITRNFIFQSNTKRFYIENNTVKRIVYLGGSKDEYNSSFSR